MPDVGPTYCETLIAAFPGSFPIEPVNAFTSLIPAAFGVVAFIMLYRRKELSVATGILILFLIAVGVGSTLWHGLRTPLTLSLDVIPGLLYFVALVFFWPTYLYNRWAGYITILTLFLLIFVSSTVLPSGFGRGPFIGLFFSVALVGAIICYLTYKKHGTPLLLLGAGALLSAVLAALFRTIDLSTCGIIPIGTHFLWHTFLGLAAFLGIMLIAKLEEQR